MYADYARVDVLNKHFYEYVNSCGPKSAVYMYNNVVTWGYKHITLDLQSICCTLTLRWGYTYCN